MITRIALMLWSTLLVLCCATSCLTQPQLKDELYVSQDALDFSPEGGEQQLQVLSSAMDWTPASADEGAWITLLQKGDSLHVTVAQNPGESRSSWITIHAGTSLHKIAVRQKAKPNNIGLSQDTVLFNATNTAPKTVMVTGLYSSVQVQKGDPEQEAWFDFAWMPQEKLLKIFLVGEPPKKAQEAKIVVRTSDSLVEIPVCYEKGEEFFFPIILPTTAKNHITTLIAQETKRGNLHGSTRTTADAQEVTMVSAYPLFGDVTYVFPKNGLGTYRQVSTFLMSDKQDDIAAYKTFLLTKGFKVDPDNSNDDETIMMSDDESFRARLVYYNQITQVLFEKEAGQTEEYPTFESFPFAEEALTEQWTLDKVKSYEQGKGNELLTEFDPTYYFASGLPGVTLYYDLADQKVAEIGFTSNKISYAAWYSNSTTWKITREFDALMKKHGYKLTTKEGNAKTYTNTEKGLALDVQILNKNLIVRLYIPKAN